MNNVRKLLFIGHTYHKKTGSSDFFRKFLENEYVVDTFFDETWAGGTPLDISAIGVSDYAVIILWQQINYVLHPDIDKHPNVILVPMFDCHAQNLSEFQRFIGNTNLKFINFCRAQHETCMEYGLKSFSAQYFPEPEKFDSSRNYGELVGFFWPRRKEITWDMVAKLISNGQISRLLFHSAPDRGFPPAIPPEKARKRFQMSISEWFDSKDAFLTYLQKANIYFAPRLYEGIGLSFLEAMAMGMCVVAPDTPTMNEYITHGVNGLLYDPGHPAPLDFSEAQRLGARARQSVEAGHKCWLKVIDDILDFIVNKPVIIRSIQYKAPAEGSLSEISNPSTLHNLVVENRDAISATTTRLYGGLRTQGKVKKHTEEHPLITIATVTYNTEKELPGTLTSILSQTYNNIELIIVDGDSTDDTLQIIKDNERLIDLWISEPDKGPYDAMNKAADLARGEWILFLNAGDWLTDNSILEAIVKNTPHGADIIYGHHYYRHINGNMFWHKANAFEWTHAMLEKGQLTNEWVKGIPGHQATMTRTLLLRKTRYDIKRFSYASDHDFLFKMSKAGCNFHHTDLTIAVYTSGGFSWQNAADCMCEQWHIARKYGSRRLVDKFYKKRIKHAQKEQNLLHSFFFRFITQGLKNRFTVKLLHTLHLLKTYVVIWKSGLFSSRYYSTQYPETSRGMIKTPLRHYILRGANNRKNPNPLFDTGYYLDRNPDVAECGINPLYHYIICGAKEGREPSPHISMAEYLEQNPDLDPKKINPLWHFIKKT